MKVNVWVEKEGSGHQEHQIGLFKLLCWIYGEGYAYLLGDYTITIKK